MKIYLIFLVGILQKCFGIDEEKICKEAKVTTQNIKRFKSTQISAHVSPKYKP